MSAEIDQLEQQINDQLTEIDKELGNYKKKEPSQRLKHLQKCEQKCKTINYTIESLELEISSLDRAQKLRYADTLGDIKKRFQNIKNEIEIKRGEATNTKSLFQERTIEKPINEMNGQELVQYGNQIQDKGLEALDGIQIQVHQGNQMADDINLELARQLDVIEKAHDTTKNIQVVQKRNENILKYFQRNLSCDWCMMVMICLIVVAIVVIIILVATGKAGKGKSNDLSSIINGI